MKAQFIARKIVGTVALTLSVLTTGQLITACGSAKPAGGFGTWTAGAKPAGGFGTWTAGDEATGAVYHLTIKPVPPVDPGVEAVEAFRSAAGAADIVSYVVVTIDNANGLDSTSPQQVQLVDAAGHTTTFDTAWNWVIGQPGAENTSGYETVLGNSAVEVANDGVLPGAKATEPFVSSVTMPTPVRVFVDGNPATLTH